MPIDRFRAGGSRELALSFERVRGKSGSRQLRRGWVMRIRDSKKERAWTRGRQSDSPPNLGPARPEW
jgi:hypothetical protein